MSFSKRLLSAVLSCAMVCTGAVPVANAETYDTDYQYNDTTYSTESKETSGTVLKSFFMTNGNKQSQEDPFDVFSIYKAYKEKATTTATTVATTQTTTTTVPVTEPETTSTEIVTTDISVVVPQNPSTINRESWGIDVSQWQGKIDWTAVKDAGVEFAIIRAGYGRQLSQKDPTFDYNVQNAQALGIDTGVYWYSYATTVEQAKQEAEVCYEIIKDYDFNYPIYFDIEDPTQERLSTAVVSAMTETFCSTLEEKGYYVGIYSSAFFLTSKIYADVLNKYAVWVAHFGVSRPSYNNPYGIWQYSSTGRVNGISGDVDMNHGYVYYPSVITGKVPSEGTSPNTPFGAGTYKGVEYSDGYGSDDWAAAKKSGIDFAIINAGKSGVPSASFMSDYNAVKEAGICAGAYWTTSAVTSEEILADAESCYETIKDLQLEYPVYLKLDESVYQDMTAEEVSIIATQFCAYLQQFKYYVGVYGNKTFLETKLSQRIFDAYDVLLSSYESSKPNFVPNSKYGIWEYSENSDVEGLVNGSYSLSGSWRDYGEVMKEYHLNGF